MAAAQNEVEIKLPARDLAALPGILANLGFRCTHPRTFESNVLLDTSEGSLRSQGMLLRVREYGDESLVTFKGPELAGRHKVREEVETSVDSPAAILTILAKLGHNPVFRYEKYRAEYTDGRGIAVVDETPIGDYIELEGSPDWIDRTAQLLGFTERDYITKSYGKLYVEHCERNSSAFRDMVFSDPAYRAGPKIP